MRATAQHILVDSEVIAETLKEEIIGGADFGDVAREHSLCPSSQKSIFPP